MSDEKDFASSSEGSAVDKFALFCAVVSIACVFGAHGMDKLARNGSLPVVAFQRPSGQGPVDYTPTASIPGQASKVQINPCVAPGSNR